MHALGVRGVRINVSPVQPPEAGLAQKLLPRIEQLRRALPRARLAPRLPAARLADSELMRRWARCKCDFTLAHMGMFLAKDGPQQPGFQRLLACCDDGRDDAGSS